MLNSQKAHKTYRAYDAPAFNNPNHAKSYSRLGSSNTRKRKILETLKKEFPSNFPADNRKAILSAVHVKESTDFKRGIDAATTWLSKEAWLSKEEYVLIVEGSDEEANKSSTWLAHQVIAKLGRPWGVINYKSKLNFEKYGGFGSKTTASIIAKAQAAGVRLYVHLDDALYSGLQKTDLLHDFSSRMKRKGYTTLLLAAAYSTDVATSRVESAIEDVFDANPRVDIKFFAAKTIESVPTSFRDMRYRGKPINFSQTLTIMPHKIPNSVSFGYGIPGSISKHKMQNLLRNKVGREVYKRSGNYDNVFNYDDHSSSNSHSSNNNHSKSDNSHSNSYSSNNNNNNIRANIRRLMNRHLPGNRFMIKQLNELLRESENGKKRKKRKLTRA